MEVIDWIKLILAGIVAVVGTVLFIGYVLLRQIDRDEDRWP